MTILGPLTLNRYEVEKVIQLQKYCILVYSLIGMESNCSNIYKSRLNWSKWEFDKRQAIYDLEHPLALALATILNAWLI